MCGSSVSSEVIIMTQLGSQGTTLDFGATHQSEAGQYRSIQEF